MAKDYTKTLGEFDKKLVTLPKAKSAAKKAADSIKTDTVKKTDKALGKDAKMLPKSKSEKKLPKASKVLESVKKSFLGSSYVDSNGKTARDNYDANPYTQEKQDKFWQGLATEKGLSGTFGRVYTGIGKGFVDATTSIPSFIASKVTGKDIDLKKSMGFELPKSADALQNTTAFKVGEVGGNLLGYGAQNIAAAPAIDAILAKTKLGQMAANAGTKLGNTGVGRLAGEEAAKRFTTGLARNAVEAGTVGLAQNVGMAAQDGLTGTDFAKDVALNTGIDLVGGSALEALPFSWAQVKGAKRTASDWLNERNAKKALETATPQVDEVIDTAKKVDVNNYKAHDVVHDIKKIDLVPESGAVVGPEPTAADSKSSLEDIISNNTSEVKLRKPERKLKTELPKSHNGKELKPGGADVNKNMPEIKVSKSKSQSFLPENERVTYEAETHAQRDYMADMRLETDYEGEYEDLISKEKFTTEDSATAGKIIEKEIAEGNIGRATKMARKAVQDASLKGQEFEALKHVSEKSPEGKLLRATRAAKNATEQLKKENPRRYEVSQEQAQAIVDIVDEANKNAVSGSFGSIMKKYVKTSGETLARNAEKTVGLRESINRTPELQKAFDNIVKELSAFAESEKLPKIDVPYKHVTQLAQQIAQAQNNPKKYAQVLAYAKKILFDKYSDNEKAMEKLGEFFAYSHKNYTEKAVNMAVKDFLNGDALAKIAKSNKNDREEALKQIRQTIVTMVNPNKRTLDNLVNDIDKNFDEIVNDKRNKLIKSILAPKKSAIQKSLYQRAAERINLSEQFIESEIESSVKQALKDSEIEIGNLIKQSPEEKTLVRDRIQSIVEANLKKYGVETDYAAEISSQCRKSYDELLKTETEKVLKRRFGEKKVLTRQAKSVFEDITELINMGAYDNEDIVNMMLERGNVPVLTPAKAQQIVDYMKKAENASGYEKRMWEARAEQIISDIEQSSAHEKFRSLQRISLLSNPKTLVTRNAGGNILLMAAENIKDIPASVMDKIVSLKTGQRTTSLDISKAKAQAAGLKKGVSEQIKDIKNGVDTSPSRAKYELPNKTIWDVNRTDGKFKRLGYGVMNTLDKVIGKSLQFGDRPFYEAAYNSRKAELENLAKKGKSNLSPEEIEESAKLFALDRTFQGDTWLAQRAKAIKKPLGIVGDLIMPFTQTPANILDKLIDYSPAGLGKAMYELGKTSKGTFDQKRFVDIIGRTFTGSGAIMLGYVLNQKGLLTGDIYKETEGGKEYNARQYAGEQEYSLKLGNEYISISWADPVGSLLMIGADFSQAFGTDKESLVTALYQSTKAAANGVFDRSFMSGIAEFLGGNGEISDKIIDGLLEQASQVTPNIGVAITKIIDPVKRETYDANPLKKQLNVIKSRTPIISKTLPEKKDIMGNTVYQYQGRDTKDRILESMLLPYNKSQVKKDSVNDYLIDMYNRTGNENVLIGKAGKEINFNGTKYKIDTAEDYSKYQELLGKKSAKAVANLRKDAKFLAKSDTEKAKALASALSDARKEAGEEYLISKKVTNRTDVNFSKLSSNRREKFDSNKINKEKYIDYFSNVDTDGSGSITQKEAQAKIDSMNLTQAQKIYLWNATNKGWKNNPYE